MCVDSFSEKQNIVSSLIIYAFNIFRVKLVNLFEGIARAIRSANINWCVISEGYESMYECESISNADTDGSITKVNFFNYFISFFSLKKNSSQSRVPTWRWSPCTVTYLSVKQFLARDYKR